MDYASLTTVDKVASYVKTQIDIYRRFPSKKEDIVIALTPVFELQSECWPLILDAGRFRVTFRRKMGKNGMKHLRRILLIIDKEHYQDVEFEEE